MTSKQTAQGPVWAADALAVAVLAAGHYPCREFDDGTGDELCPHCSDALEGVVDWPCPVAQLLTSDIQDLVRLAAQD